MNDQEKYDRETEDHFCPNCNVSLRGDRIPENIAEHYYGTHWDRKIGIEDPYVYDGVSWWLCPDCGHLWKRFPWSPEYSGDVSELLKHYRREQEELENE